VVCFPLHNLTLPIILHGRHALNCALLLERVLTLQDYEARTPYLGTAFSVSVKRQIGMEYPVGSGGHDIDISRIRIERLLLFPASKQRS